MESISFVRGSMVTARNENGVNFGTPCMPVVFTALTWTMPSHLHSEVHVLALVMLISLRCGFSISDRADSLTQLICAPESTRIDRGVRPMETDPESRIESSLGPRAPSRDVP